MKSLNGKENGWILAEKMKEFVRFLIKKKNIENKAKKTRMEAKEEDKRKWKT